MDRLHQYIKLACMPCLSNICQKLESGNEALILIMSHQYTGCVLKGKKSTEKSSNLENPGK
jgi:hypothetical protein